MPDSTDSLMIQLGTYVSDLKAQRESGKTVAARGSTLKIFGAIAKLREIGESGIEESIAKALDEAQLDFDPSTHYRNICWHCYRDEGTRRFLDARVERTCPKCGWLICFHCGHCCAPDHGGCTRTSSVAP
jgi:hypothetical protein